MIRRGMRGAVAARLARRQHSGAELATLSVYLAGERGVGIAARRERLVLPVMAPHQRASGCT